MNSEFHDEFDGLIAKFAELLTGSDSPEMMEKIKIWSVYNHIHKTMPALASHWNQTHPEGKAAVRRLYEEVRELNQALKAKNQSQD